MVSQRSKSGKRFSAINLAVFASLGASSVLANTQTSTWVGPASSTWNTAAAWSPSGVPNNNTNGFTDYNVIIGTPAPAILNISPTIDDLTINTGGTLGIQFSSTLTLNGSTQVDNGQIVINSNTGGAVAELAFDFAGTTSLTGSGTITLNEINADAQLDTGTGDTLSQASGHTIAGFGEVNAALINNGTVTANVSNQTLSLGTDNMANSATFSATNDGTLSIGGITVTQGASGKISAATGSEVLLSNDTISGGSISTAGTGFVLLPNSGATSTFANVTSNATVDVQFDSALNITGNLVDNGTVTINSDTGGAVSAVNFSGGVLSGTGTFVLQQPSDDAQINGTLTQSAGHSITGYGQINAALTNNGLVNANINAQTMTLATSSMTNNATIEATAGGNLSISGITVTQGTAGLISVAPGGTLTGQLTLSNSTISGGTISTSGSGFVLLPNNGSTNTFANVTSNAKVNVQFDSALNITGNLVDNGTVTINSDTGGAVSAVNFSGGTLSGTGTFVLQQPSDDAQINGTLTQSAGHSITGYGQINAALTNNGLVNANITAQTMTLATSNMANNATMEATNGGTLNISGITIAQGAAGSITAASGSTVSVVGGSTITGGSITANNGTLQFSGGAVLDGTTITATNSTVVIPLNTNGTAGFAASFGGVTISSGTVVNEQYGNVVDVTSSTLTNNGSIIVNSNQGGAVAALDFDFVGNTQLNGSGTITLQEPGADAQLNTGTGDTLTQAAGHTIQGYGEISATLTNNGTVTANVVNQTLSLLSDNMTNSGTFSATNGGTLAIDGITVTQSVAGKINVGPGSVVSVVGGTPSIVGGTISTAAPGTVEFPINDNTTATFVNVTSDATINLRYNNALNITGNLVDNGTLNINPNQGGAVAAINFAGGTLLGTGTFVLSEAADDAQVNGTLTQAASHSITGFGYINAALTNNGLVNANVSGQTLTLTSGNEVNNSTIEATAGGDLAIAGITVTQGSAGLISVNPGGTLAGALSLAGTLTISGGTLVTSGNGTIEFPVNQGTTATFANVTSDAIINLRYNNALDITGNLVDNGTVNINPNEGGAVAAINFAGGTLLGTGTFVLSEAADDAQVNGTLTQAASHSITGFGYINAALTNNGLVNANVSGQTMTLATNNKVNNSTIEVTAGGSLTIDSVTVTQGSAGLISVNPGGTLAGALSLAGTPTISGGTIATFGNGTVEFPVNEGTTATFANVTSNATINLRYNNALNITGNLVDNGTININPNEGGAVAAINFAGGTLSGTGALVLSEGADDAQVNGTLTQSASHSITGFGQINATLTNNGIVNANVSGQTLTIAGPLTGTGSLVVGAGATMEIGPGTGLEQQKSLSVNVTGSLDLTNNALDINYGAGNPSPISTIQSEIISGYNGGSWNGAGIRSSSAAANHAYAVGYADGSVDTDTPAVPGQILTEYTLVGDVNLDGTVNLTDLLILLNNYGLNGRDWAEGDMNYDGTTNLTDLLSLLNNYGLDTNGIVVGGFQSSQVVPEPVSGGILMMAAGGTLMSRRRRANKGSC